MLHVVETLSGDAKCGGKDTNYFDTAEGNVGK